MQTQKSGWQIVLGDPLKHAEQQAWRLGGKGIRIRNQPEGEVGPEP